MPKNRVPFSNLGPPFSQPLLLSIPSANKTPVIQHWVNIYSLHTILELKAEGHAKVKTLKRKSYLLGQCYNLLGVECDPWWILITTGGITWSRRETSGTGAEYLDPLPTPSRADIAEILFYSLLDFSFHGCKMGVMNPTRKL